MALRADLPEKEVEELPPLSDDGGCLAAEQDLSWDWWDDEAGVAAAYGLTEVEELAVAAADLDFAKAILATYLVKHKLGLTFGCRHLLSTDNLEHEQTVVHRHLDERSRVLRVPVLAVIIIKVLLL